jgi:ribosomal protein S18 acetylase RimI-like enzyme
MPTKEIQIEILELVTAAAVTDIQRLMRQLTSSVPEDATGPLETIVQAPDSDIVVARDGEKVVGMAVVNVVHKVHGREGRIDEVVVDEDYRGHGIASRLMQRAVDELRNRGCGFVELTSSARREAANKLYQALKFEPRQTNVYRLKLQEEHGA